jgi:hypothetical protein
MNVWMSCNTGTKSGWRCLGLSVMFPWYIAATAYIHIDYSLASEINHYLSICLSTSFKWICITANASQRQCFWGRVNGAQMRWRIFKVVGTSPNAILDSSGKLGNLATGICFDILLGNTVLNWFLKSGIFSSSDVLDCTLSYSNT